MSLVINRKARFEYFIVEEYDAGLVLTGSEVKSIKSVNITLNDSFIFIKKGEVFIKNLKISRYKHAHPSTEHDENRDKKLLLTKKQISKISKYLHEKGNTCVPLKIFIKSNRIKVKIGIAKGKKLYDKRNSIKERDIKRDLQRNY